MTRLTKLTDYFILKGKIIKKKIKLYEDNNRNANSDFSIIISMKGDE